ncbi:MAG: T9SS type A sorting domain-containing protein [Bacteroidales bacterium]
MKKKSLFLLIMLFAGCAGVSYGQAVIHNKMLTGVCYAGNKVNRIYIPPPKRFTDSKGTSGGGKINVIYSGFTADAKAAVAYAVSILEALLPPDLNMTVKTSWTEISTIGVLGNSSITGFVAGWSIDGQNPAAFYPVTVGEKIAAKSLNEDYEADVELILNSTAKWYLGTDGRTPVTRYDLVTVVLHELCHGLGFFDSMGVSGSTGYYGIGSAPLIYDTFVANLLQQRLTDTTIFEQNSAALYREMIGGQLYFDGPLTRNFLGTKRAELFSPSTWDSGSSVSHLDEANTEQVNALMTPYLDFGEAIHDPGSLTFSILGDVGWINTRIVTAKNKDTEELLTQLDISASIRSDTTYNRDMVGLVYSYDGFNSRDSLIMNQISTDNYEATVPVPSYNMRVDYFIYAVDRFSRIYRSPSLAEKRPNSIYVGIDTVKPVILHTPPDYFFENIDSVLFDAKVADNLAIDTVYVEYSVNSIPAGTFGLTSAGGDKYTAKFNVRPESLKGGDILNYRIVAVDKASGRNMRMLPATGYYDIRIEALLPSLGSYSTDFTDAADDFFNSGLEITKPLNFKSNGLHSGHPYKSPEEDNKTLDFSSVLRHPIIFSPSGMVISFREVVLVEPGAEGSVFGFSDFYDYVIVEASDDFGKSWFALADGYDSRVNSAWESAYNGSIDGQNSTYAGKESMMLEHWIYPRINDRVADGDSLLIRFRLFSDPYANGWGWAIDDLKINPLVDEVGEVPDNSIRIYPNPGNGFVTIVHDGPAGSLPVTIRVFNSRGQPVLNSLPSIENQMKIDISHLARGLYLIVIDYGNRIKTVKYNLIK